MVAKTPLPSGWVRERSVSVANDAVDYRFSEQVSPWDAKTHFEFQIRHPQAPSVVDTTDPLSFLVSQSRCLQQRGGDAQNVH